jgi:TPR repeat protein
MDWTGDSELDKAIDMLHKEEYEKALQVFSELADTGHPHAMHFLGWMCEQGLACEIDFERAAHWWLLAAENGVPESQIAMGSCYEEGQGVDKDLVKSYFWYGIASRALEEESGKCLERLGNIMTKSQLESAKALLADA